MPLLRRADALESFMARDGDEKVERRRPPSICPVMALARQCVSSKMAFMAQTS
ncbi:hypothetical protein NEE01_14310 [Sphingomonas sp. MMSM24]|uniref:Uncharacterized protein n=1 Tax=Sphingomonas lycopersici TaxID=2951807 RepID=A0AA42CR51_9SPHN|nr:hypothetical protein [Sphingomonas lycopersici]